MIIATRLLITASILFGILLVPQSFAAQLDPEKRAVIEELGYDPDNLVVKFASDIPSETIDYLNQQFSLGLDYDTGGKLKILDISLLYANPELLAVLEDKGVIEYAEPEYYCSISAWPNDPFFYQQWNLKGYEYSGINAVDAWDITTGSPDVVIAVVDTGVAYENYSETIDGNVYTYAQAPDFAETNFVSPRHFYISGNDILYDDHANDMHGHGTHIAGVIAQTTNNGYKVAGIAHSCSVMPVRVFGIDGTVSVTVVAEGVKYAADQGADVINLSLQSYEYSQVVKDAIDYAENSGCVIVAASGNYGSDGNPFPYPAGFDNVIAVGATDYNKLWAYYSNYGDYLDVVAPGSSIVQENFSTAGNYINFTLRALYGTSFAAPHVSAIAGLLISNGLTDPVLVRRAIEESARDLGPAGWDEKYGYGLVNAYDALTYFSVADFDYSGAVDEVDLVAFLDSWLSSGSDLPEDLTGDGIINLADFAVFNDNWLHNIQ